MQRRKALAYKPVDIISSLFLLLINRKLGPGAREVENLEQYRPSYYVNHVNYFCVLPLS